jgi:poly(A) polymerase
MKQTALATKIVSTLQEKGHIAYFAGGWVRDFLLHVPSDDIDIATTASTEEIASLFSKTIPIGIAFGIIIVIEEGHSFEVATFRKEKEYVDGRRPTQIEPATPEEDAQRRDFTINGLFFDPLAGKILDFVGGEEDLKQGIVRAIGDPHKRFLEDRLRMIRAVRYSIRFQFPIECDTRQAILSHAASLFPSVAIERVWQEFQKMSRFACFEKSLLLLHELKLLPVIFPSLKEVSLSEIRKRTRYLPMLPLECPLIAKLLFLFPNLSLEEKLEFCDFLKLSRQEKAITSFLHQGESLLLMPLDWQISLENIEWAYFYAHPLSSLSLSIALLHIEKELVSRFCSFHKEKKEKLHSHIERIQKKKPLIQAADLRALGILPGVQMGKLLKEAERVSINEGIEDKQAVLAYMQNRSLFSF